MREVHVIHVIPSFYYRIEHDPIRSKFLVPEKCGTRMHDTRAEFLWYEFLVPVLGGELGSCAMGLIFGTHKLKTYLNITYKTLINEHVNELLLMHFYLFNIRPKLHHRKWRK